MATEDFPCLRQLPPPPGGVNEREERETRRGRRNVNEERETKREGREKAGARRERRNERREGSAKKKHERVGVLAQARVAESIERVCVPASRKRSQHITFSTCVPEFGNPHSKPLKGLSFPQAPRVNFSDQTPFGQFLRLPCLTPREGPQGPAFGRGLGNLGLRSPLPFVVLFDTYSYNSTTTPATATPAEPPEHRPESPSPRRAGGRRTSPACGSCRRPLGVSTKERRETKRA